MSSELPRDCRAFWVTAPGVGEIRTAPLQPPGPDAVVVQALYSGVSRGTESLVFNGRVPPSLHASMRGPHQQGEFTFPVKYGYAVVGRVVAGPGVGRTVFCLHPHQTHFSVAADAVIALPPQLPPGRAVMAALMETALTAVWDARLSPGDKVTVVGGGVVGCLTARLAAQVPGCEVELVDINPDRASVAQALGVAFANPAQAHGGADVVFHASASSDGLQLSLDLAGPETTIVELSWFGEREVTLKLGGAFHPDRLSLVSSQVGSIPAHQARRWTHRRRMGLALRLLADDALDELLEGESPFEQLPQTMARLAAPGATALCHRICYP